MKTKVYFVIIIAIQIILAIYSIATADSIVQTQLADIQETANMMPGMEQDLMSLVMTKREVVVVSLSNILLNIIALIVVLKNQIVKRKGTLIAIYVIYLMTTPNTLASWIAVINIIVLLCIKRGNKEDKKKLNMKEAEETLKVEGTRIEKKKIILMVVLVLVYLLQLIPDSMLPESKTFLIIYIGSIYLALLVLSISVFWKDIKNGFKLIKANFKTYVKYTLRVLGIMFIFYFMAAMISAFTTEQIDPVNQQILEVLPMGILAPIAIIWAPIVEESLYRGVIRKLIKNDIVYIIISSVLFGLAHVMGEATIGAAIANGIPYAILGGGFTYIYCKTNNMAGNIIAHSAYNTLGVLLMLLG